jgi:hypothetical protein
MLSVGSGIVTAGPSRDTDTPEATCPGALMESNVSVVSDIIGGSDVNIVGSVDTEVSDSMQVIGLSGIISFSASIVDSTGVDVTEDSGSRGGSGTVTADSDANTEGSKADTE